MDENGVRGGQGRSANDVTTAAKWMLIIFVAALLMLAASLLTGCACTYSERSDGTLQPNLPSKHELRGLNTL
jgi:hypothetical protein